MAHADRQAFSSRRGGGRKGGLRSGVARSFGAVARITEIKRQKRRPDRVSVFLDGEFWTGMSEGLFLELGLRSDEEITDERKREIETLVVEDKALGWALERLTERMLSEAKLREKLAEREYGPAVIDLVCERCREYGLLDDRALAEHVIESGRERGHGRRRVEQRLRDLGIDRELARGLVEEAFDPKHEADEAAEVLERRFGEERLDPREQRRATQFLLRRGFSPGAAREAVARRAMSAVEQERSYGSEHALEELRRRYRRRAVDSGKAFGYLARRGYSPEAARRAVASYEEETASSSSNSSA